jgi:magnesium-transporting ATPase (P-type)
VLSSLVGFTQVAFVTATNNYNKELQFRALRSDANAMVRVRVLRNGSDVPVPISDIVVGDVVHLETGDKVCMRAHPCA